MLLISLDTLKIAIPQRSSEGFFFGRLIILIAFFLLPNISQSKPSWEDILLYENGRSSVTSQEYFTSPNGRFDSKEELTSSLSLIKSSSKTDFACEFPFRYEWLRENHQNIPDFDFSMCKDLNAFKKNIVSDSIKLGFASEQVDTPASAFGHIFIVFEHKSKPKLLSPSIQFLAEVEGKDNPFTYSYKGLTGGFDGFYQITPFYKLAFTYNEVQQRDIFTTEVTTDPQKIERLIYRLFEMRKVKIPYFFTSGNCSNRLADLLISAELYPVNRQKLFPTDVFSYYFETSSKLSVSPSTHTKATEIIKRFNQQELAEWSSYTNKEIVASELETNLTKELASLQSQYEFRRNQSPPENYSEIAQLTYKNSNGDHWQKIPSKNNFMQLNMTQNLGDFKNTLIGLRPGFKNLWEEAHLNNNLNSLVMGETVLSVNDIKKVSLDQFNLISITAINPIDTLSKKNSWKASLGYKPDLNNQNRKIESELGVGYALRSNKLIGSIFFDLGGRVNEPIFIGGTGSIKFDINPKQIIVLEQKYRDQGGVDTSKTTVKYQHSIGSSLLGVQFTESSKVSYLGLSYSINFR